MPLDGSGSEATAQEQCVALMDYQSDLDDEISFKKGDIISVLAKNCATGYWLGTINGKSGLFPNCMCSSNMQPNRVPKFVNKAMALHPYVPQKNMDMPLEKGDIVAVLRPSSSPGWWCGVNETAVERLEKKGDMPPEMIEAQCGSIESPLLFPSNYVTGRIVLAEYNFHGRAAHELTFSKGDVVYVHRKWNDGWWEGTLRGKRGIFPSNFTVPNVATTSPAFFCNRCKSVMQPGSQECKECAKFEETTKTMLRAVEDYKSGLLQANAEGNFDLFEYVDLDPAMGRGALLSKGDQKDAASAVKRPNA